MNHLTAWRSALAGLLMIVIGIPLLLPFYESVLRADLRVFREQMPDLVHLFSNTVLLVVGVLLVSMPLGTLVAVLLFRTNLPFRRLLITAFLLVLFVPLPLHMSAWQALLGPDGWLPWQSWQSESRMWTTGLAPAIWLHSLAGIPWVVLIVGSGLCWVERELEEEALLDISPWHVLLHVTLPRSRGSLAAAACWLALSTFGEITVVYFVQLPTFAEAIQTQFSGGDPQAQAQAVILSLPVVIPLLVLLGITVPRLEGSLPPLQASSTKPRIFALGRRQAIVSVVVGLIAFAFALPLMGLVWKVGLSGTPMTWSLPEASSRLQAESRVALVPIGMTALVALATAMGLALLSLVCCWLAKDSRWLRWLLVFLVALDWSLPGPVIGIGLKELILAVHLPVWDHMLYYGPSPLPIVWAQLIRFFPVALALLWPMVRRVPTELLEQARLEGAAPLGELVHAVWPQVASGFRWSVIVLTALCLGEVSASNRVETAGWESFGKLILDRMHYGVDGTVAAWCLLLLAFLAVVTGASFGLRMLLRPRGK